MGLFDKIGDFAEKVTDSASKMAEEKGVFDKMDNIKEKASDAMDNMTSGVKDYRAEAAEAKKPLEGCIQWYNVVYKGGLANIDPKKTKAGSGSIGMNIMPDSFYFKPLKESQDWFQDLEIPYDNIKKFEIIKRTVSNTETLLSNGANDAAALATLNTMAITYDNENGDEVYLKMEMLTGFTVQGQATKCEEMMDVLRINKILPRLNKQTNNNANNTSVADELKKFKDLLDAGVITQEEFDAKKNQLLGI